MQKIVPGNFSLDSNLSVAQRQVTLSMMCLFACHLLDNLFFFVLEASGSPSNPVCPLANINGLCRNKNKSNKSKRKVVTEWKCVMYPEGSRLRVGST